MFLLLGRKKTNKSPNIRGGNRLCTAVLLVATAHWSLMLMFELVAEWSGVAAVN